MPLYGYRCEECECQFDRLLGVSERDQPISEPCPECGENGVKKLIDVCTMGVDANLTPDRATGGDWSKLMDRMKKGNVSKKYHKNLNRATDSTGRKFGPQ